MNLQLFCICGAAWWIVGEDERALGLVADWERRHGAVAGVGHAPCSSVEAVLFHELSHVVWDEERAAAVLVGHEFAGFRAELEAYGPWTADLRAAGETFRQLPLWPSQDEDEDER